METAFHRRNKNIVNRRVYFPGSPMAYCPDELQRLHGDGMSES